MTIFTLYLAYGAFYTYHLFMKDLVEDFEWDGGGVLALILMVVLWPVLPFLCANDLADTNKRIED